MNTGCFPEQTAETRPDVQQQRGPSSLLAGVAFVPMLLLGVSVTPLSARIVERAGPGGYVRPREAAGRRGSRRAAGSHEPRRHYMTRHLPRERRTPGDVATAGRPSAATHGHHKEWSTP
jgi:hypothetical protein